LRKTGFCRTPRSSMSIFSSATPTSNRRRLMAASNSLGVGNRYHELVLIPTMSELLMSFCQASRDSFVPKRLLTASSSMDCRISSRTLPSLPNTSAFRMSTTLAAGSALASPRIPVPRVAAIAVPAATRRKSLRVIIFSSI